MLPIDEALALVRHATPALPAEDVALDDATGRVLAEDAFSDVDLPPFDRAAMDGYALRAHDVAAAPVALELIGEVRAGQASELEVWPGQAARIMTGAPLPRGADAVQPVEKTQPLDEFRVTIRTAVALGAHVAPRGSELRAGGLVLAHGRLIDPSAVAALAAAGRSRVSVARRPVVAVLVTGDELVDVTATPGPGQIRNSNGPALVALARQAGADVRTLGVVGDRREALAEAVSQGLAADVLVVSGGVSAGDYDLVEPVLLEAGASFLFTAVAIKPGAPLVFGRLGATLVFGLPGNPVSAQVTFELFVRPCLLRLQGARVDARPRVSVLLEAAVDNHSGRTAHLPARVRSEAGRLVARPLASKGSGDLIAHARANALIVIDAQRRRAEAGETVEAVLLGRFLEDDGAPLD